MSLVCNVVKPVQRSRPPSHMELVNVFMSFVYTPCSEKKNLQFSLNSFNKSKHIFTIFGAHYPENTFY